MTERMAVEHFDLFVIGAGSGGVRAARVAASLGAKVAIAEERYLGGTCVNVGCVPKKLYVYASEYGKGFKDAQGFGWVSKDVSFDWATLRDNKCDEISRLNAVYERLLETPGAQIIEGTAQLVGPNQVAVNGKTYSADKILLATGSWPYVPDLPGGEHMLTSNEIFDLEVFPKRLAILGGGYIATEFAGIFNGLGSRVTQLYRGDLFMRGFDADVRSVLAREVRKSGVDLRFNTSPTAIERLGNELHVHLADDSRIEVDAVLCATGRRPKLDGLGLEKTDVTLTDQGHIEVNEHFQTKDPSIFALGDITGGPQLTPIALAEGMAFAHREFGNGAKAVDYGFIPTAVFSQPNVGTVGYTEEEARNTFGAVTVYRSEFKPMKHTISGRDERSMMKLLVSDSDQRVVGLHMVGPDAGEIVQGMAIAIRMGATKSDFDSTIGIHPSAAAEFVTLREPVAS